MQVKAGPRQASRACLSALPVGAAGEGERGGSEEEKRHNFDPDTEMCTRCGMTVREYESHGRPPCRGNLSDG